MSKANVKFLSAKRVNLERAAIIPKLVVPRLSILEVLRRARKLIAQILARVFVFAAESGEELIHKIIRHFRRGALPVSLFKFYIKARSGASGYLMYGLRVSWFLHQDAPKREISYPINFSWPSFIPLGLPHSSSFPPRQSSPS